MVYIKAALCVAVKEREIWSDLFVDKILQLFAKLKAKKSINRSRVPSPKYNFRLVNESYAAIFGLFGQ